MIKWILVALTIASIGQLWADYRISTARPDYRKFVYDACMQDSFCESIIDVHFSHCFIPAFGDIQNQANPDAYEQFASCVNQASGYELLTVALDGSLRAKQLTY